MALPKALYLRLFLFWLAWVTARTLLFAFVFGIFSALSVYIYKGFAPLQMETFYALLEIFYLSFPVGFSLGYIIMLLFVFKALFYQKIKGHLFMLYGCQNEELRKPFLSDVMSLWRKWLFVTVWLVLLFCVLFLGISRLLSGEFPPLSWFNPYTLYVLVSAIGGTVFVYGIKKCKKIGVRHV